MSEWDDTTREAGHEAARQALDEMYGGQLPPSASDAAADAVLAVVDAVPRAEHERVVAELERLRQDVRAIGQYARRRADAGPNGAWAALDHVAAQLCALVNGGQS